MPCPVSRGASFCPEHGPAVDGDAAIQGNIVNQFGSVVTLQDRSFLGDRSVTYTGTLTCTDTSQTFFSNVKCGQTCSGAIPGSCVP